MSSTITIIKPGRLMVSIMLYVMLAYFVYHILSGERGLLSYMHLSSELKEKQQILQSLISERELLEKKVELMGNGNIDADTLDELARENLGLIGEGEEVWIIEGLNE